MNSTSLMIAAGILTILGNGRYALTAYRGSTRPNILSWSLWSVIPLIMFFAQRAGGTGSQSYLSLAVGLTPILVVFSAWLGTHLSYKVKPADLVCIAICVIALILWALTGKSIVAVIISIIAGSYASLLTLLHGYHHPEEENVVPFVCGIISAAITLLTMQSFYFMAGAFAIYLLISNAALAFVIGAFPRLKKP